MSSPVVYKEGMLLKRQRGLHTNNTRKLKFQERFCCLTSTSLDYYDPLPKKRAEGPKGQFAVEKMKIIEPMKNQIFGREFPYALQIGDHQEIMYFVADTEALRDDWLEAFKLASHDAKVLMLPQHHHGVYGLLNKGRWSCCANQRRDTVGCSTSSGATRKDKTLTLPHPSSPSASHIEQKTSSLPRTVSETPQSAPPLMSSDTGEFQPPFIRRFTTTDPVMKPNAQKLSKLRKSMDVEKILESGESEDEPVKILSQKEHHRKDMLVIAEVDNGVRSGASSPSPSDDSGRGTSVGNSRPNSQIEDNRIIRSESVGKKPSQSVIHEQTKDEPRGVLTKQEQVEDSEDSSKTVTPDETPVRKRSTSKEEVIKDKEKSGDATKEDRESGDVGKNEEMSKGLDEIDGLKARVTRVTSSPTPYNPEMPVGGISIRPLSMGSFNEAVESGMTGSGSEVSLGDTPQQRKVKERLMDSPRVSRRPRSFLMRSFSVAGQPQYNQLQQACKDGNLDDLAKVLGSNYQCSELVNLEEPSNEEVPYTPLFIAFINDHIQTMIQLLEHGANPDNTEPVQKASVLHWACAKGCLDMVDQLLKYKADINKRDSAGNTPLMLACKNGHLDIVEFLLQNGANVDDESSVGRTPLHECSEGAQADIMDLLLKWRADPNVRDHKDTSPYDIAFHKRNTEIMSKLQQVTPEIVRPYSLLQSHRSTRGHMITSLAFKSNDILVSGSRDSHAHFWDTSDLSELDSVHLSDTVLDLSVYDHTHLAVGSTTIQIVDIENRDKKRTIADDANDDESLDNPPLHLVKFGPKGRLVTASCESNVVKLWPPVVSQSGGIVTMPEAMFMVGEESQGHGCVYCLSMSPTPNFPWLAVGFQPGRIFSPKGNKLVYMYDWETKALRQIFDAGEGGLEVGVHVTFSPCGKFVAIGSAKNLCIWDPKAGDLMQKFTVEKGAHITSVTYSPNGSHLAAGLSSGEVQVFETSSSSPVFYLAQQKESPITAMAYSMNGKLFATGQQNGCIQLWEAYGSALPSSTDC